MLDREPYHKKPNKAIQKSLKKIRIGKHLSFQDFDIIELDKGHVSIGFEATSYDRSSGGTIKLRTFRKVRKTSINTPRKLLNKIREILHWFYCHEVDESLYLANKRIFDPHK